MNRRASTAATLLAAAALLGTAPDRAIAQTSVGERTASTATASTSLHADGTARRSVRATRLAAAAPVIDGVLDDAAWQSAELARDFTQRMPNPGSPSRLLTEVRTLYDDAAIYVSVRAHDPHPDSIAAPLGRRDLTGISSDWVHLMIDSYNDKRTAFRFSVNPRGVKKDAFHSNDTNEDLAWDAVWDAAVRVDADGWSVEYRVPLSQLRFSEGQGTWGLNVGREISRYNEISDWSAIRPTVNGFVSQFGELAGVDARPKRRVELLPYTVGRVTRAPGEDENPFWSRNDPFGTVGADLKLGLTSNLTLTATANPDFGQVEADPSQVNLSAFETFFGERRPFFVEGADIFRMNVGFPYSVRGGQFRNDQVFYTRRIGRAPQASSAPGDPEFSNVAEATTILAAAKVSGKTAGGLSVGILDALTGEEEVRWVEDGGARRSGVAEPMSNYLAARAIQDFRGGSSAVGGIFTATHRNLGGDDRLDFLRTDAFSAGFDGRHRFGGGAFELTGALLGTHVRGSEEAILRVQEAPGHYFQRPGASHLDVDSSATSLTGFLADVKLEKVGGSKWRGGIYGHARSPGLEMNDLGFQRNADWILQGSWIGYNQHQPGKLFRRWDANFNQWNGWSFGGERLTTGFNVNASANFHNNSGFWLSGDSELEALRADVLRGGPAFTGPAYTSGEAGFFTDGRRKLSGEMGGGTFRERGTTGYGWWTFATVNYRPAGNVSLSLGPNVNRSHDPWIYVNTPEYLGSDRYVFGTIDQTTVSLSTRLNYAFTPNLTLELYAQPFVSAGRYKDYKEVTDPTADRFVDRFHHFAADEITRDGDASELGADRDGDGDVDYTFSRPDFNFKQLRSNVVLRWEYRPGSTLFLVWGQGRTDFNDDGRFRLGRDFGRLFGRESGYSVPSTNVLVLKMNYWLSL